MTVAPPSSAAVATVIISRPRDHSRSVSTCRSKRRSSSLLCLILGPLFCPRFNPATIPQSLSGRVQTSLRPKQRAYQSGESGTCPVPRPLTRPFHRPGQRPPELRSPLSRHLLQRPERPPPPSWPYNRCR